MLLAGAFIGGVWFSRRKRNSGFSNSANWGRSKLRTRVQEMDSTPSSRRELVIPGKYHNGVYEMGNNLPAAELPAHHGAVEMDAGYNR
jgi:hypothetical protein